MFYVSKRDARNLLPLIENNFWVGTEIVSDEWLAYRKLNRYGFKHYTVNHSKNFIDPRSGRHTQLMECLWSCAKLKIIKRSRGLQESKLPGYLGEEWFRSTHIEKHGPIIFKSILNLIKKILLWWNLDRYKKKINWFRKLQK